VIVLTISGSLGRDAELKQVGQQQVLEFSVASSTKVKGEKVTTWVRASLWGSRGQSLAQYLVKGTRVTVCGAGSLRSYQAKDGTTKTELCVNVSELDFSGGGNRDATRERPSRSEPEPPAEAPAADFSAGGDDDIPF